MRLCDYVCRLLIALSAISAAGQQHVTRSAQADRAKGAPVAASFDALEVSVNGKVQRARIHIIDLGDIPAQETQKVSVTIKNVSARTVVLDMFAIGNYVSASWHDRDEPIITRKTIQPQASAGLDIELTCTDVTKQRLQLVSLAENSVPISTVLMAYVAHPATVVLPIVTGAYQSGIGKQWSTYYTVPSGPAPHGYTYVSDTFNTAGSDPAGNGRSCGFHVDCKKVQADDGDVVWSFSIEGYEHDWTHSDSSVKAEGILTVVYRLKTPQKPELKTVEVSADGK